MNINKEIPSITIEEAIGTYLNWKKSHRISAADRYKIRLDKFKEYLSIRGKHNLGDIHPDDIANYHIIMKESYSDATIAYSARILKNFFDFHKGRGNCNINPKEIIAIRFVNVQKAVLDEDEFELMSALLNQNDLEDLQKKLIIHLLWDTGMRVSELLDLTISDVQNQNSQGMYTARIRSKKKFDYDLIAWGSITNELLIQYLGWRLLVEHDSDFLFIPISKRYRRPGKAISVRTLERWTLKLAKEAMIDKAITPHSFRHGKAHYILDNGGSMRDVQAMLRHKNLENSINYVRLNKSKYLKTASRFLDNEPVKPTSKKSFVQTILKKEKLKTM